LLVNFALSRDNTRVLSIGCESIKQGACQHKKPPVYAKLKKPAAQLMLGLPIGLRRFCAPSVETNRERLQQAVSNEMKSESNLHLQEFL